MEASLIIREIEKIYKKNDSRFKNIIINNQKIEYKGKLEFYKKLSNLKFFLKNLKILNT